jgi:RNA polymerase sigma factor (sigma-70 family)
MTEQPQHDIAADQQLIDALSNQNIEVLSWILQQFGSSTARKLKRRFGDLLNDADLDDVIATALVKVWMSRTRFDERIQRLEGWFYVLARNVAIDLLRARSRERNLIRSRLQENPRYIESDSSSDTGEIVPSERLSDLYNQIRSLPKRDNQILMAYLFATPGSDWASQSARELGITENALRVRLNRLLKKLRTDGR